MGDSIDILVLGNGFDVACGLPTNYSDFFKWRVETNKSDYKLLDDLILNNEYIEGFKFQNTNYGNDFVTSDVLEYGYSTRSTEGELFGGFNLNLWDILFYTEFVMDNNCSPTNYEMMNHRIKWSNIESEIYNFVNMSFESNIGSHSSSRKYPTFSDLKNRKRGTNDRLKGMKLKFVFYTLQYLVETYQLNEYGNLFEFLDYDIILNELNKFEKSFTEYLHFIRDNYDEKYDKEANLLVKKMFPNQCKIFYLSFNYTSLYSRLYYDSGTHVHGRFDGDIIFGIDSSGIDASNKAFKFTKTRRKMVAKNKFVPISIPSTNLVQSINFFGHSLSSADYSYFKSIFDFYSIYSSNIVLVFFFQKYGERSSDELLNEQSDLIAQLLRNYGKTLPNQLDGENLLHKLLLENRLRIEEITIDRFKLHK
ncbi:AbiH family protein [Erysipelothrix rhusiopathiae]|nr:AbiH family protein [Erysipelothrix rhusiopathiae]MDE8269048.1 AbiH family protein [Erysipelothrix rhusiopathiae]MDE8270683.1 AbiH family protein [Erysipelothrix rhusiopathiae]MDE8279108.1 AbiH family protein [Erysipelothrix rhusiopathiae]MDE8319406.1 AbiH family protein [Erysipelothrix rhusiopathiae]